MANIEITLTINVVSGPNSAPVLADIADQTVETGQQISIQLSAVDIDGDTLTWTVTGLPSGVTFDNVTQQISGSSSSEQTSTVTVEVSDGTNTDSDTFDLTVEAPQSTQCSGTRKALTLGNATSTNNFAGQPASAAINGVVGADDLAGSSNWWASDGPSVGTFSLGGKQCVDGLNWYLRENNGRQYDIEAELLDENQNAIQTVVPRQLTTPRASGDPHWFPFNSVQADFVRLYMYGSVNNDSSTSPIGITQEIEAWGVELNTPVFTTPPTPGSIDTSQLININVATGQTENLAVYTAPIGVWQNGSISNANVKWRVLTRPTGNLGDNDQLRSRNTYSQVQFYSPSGDYGLSNASSGPAVFDLRSANSVSSTVVTNIRSDSRWHPTLDQVVSNTRTTGVFQRHAPDGTLISTSPALNGGLSGTNWNVAGSQGDITDDGLLVYMRNPFVDPTGNADFVRIVNVNDWSSILVNLTAISGLPTNYVLDNAVLHNSGLYMFIQPTTNVAAHIISRPNISSNVWTYEGPAEKGHGDVGTTFAGDPVWWAVGFDNQQFAPGASTSGVFEFDLNNPIGGGSPSVIVGTATTYTNSPQSFTGHLSGLASANLPGVFLVSVYEPETSTMVGLMRDDHPDQWIPVDTLPYTAGGLPQGARKQPQASINKTGTRCVAAAIRQDQPNQPMLVEYDLSGCLA